MASNITPDPTDYFCSESPNQQGEGGNICVEISRWGEILARYVRPYVSSSHLPPHLVKSNGDRWDLRGGQITI